MDANILISIVIVNYKVPRQLLDALASLRRAALYDRCEVIVVDNASNDNSREIVTSVYDEVLWIQQKRNIGFGKACNAGVERARGKFLLLLNPDAVVSEDTLASAVEFMETHPQAGLMGPKILNPDGTLQLSCRRSIPTPSVAFYYFSGLSYLFPKSRRFGRYHLTFMDENEAAQVEVISGSFMFMRRDLFCEIGGFDKRFFMYGEDIDLSYRISRAGYEVWYYPKTSIVHQKGKSSAKRRVRSRLNFYGAMITFLHKYRDEQKTIAPWWLTWCGIVFLAAMNIGATLLRYSAAAIVDFAVINVAMFYYFKHAWDFEFLGLHTKMESLYDIIPMSSAFIMQSLAAFTMIFLFLYNGIYSRNNYSAKNLIWSGLLSVALVFSGVHYLAGYPGIVFAQGFLLTVPLLLLWRGAVKLLFPKRVKNNNV